MDSSIPSLKNVALIVGFSAAALVSADLLADGTQGTSSTDSIAVTIEKLDSVRISAMEDVDFGSTAELTVDSTLPEPFCVFATNGAYQITGSTGNASTTAFQMVSGGNTLDYQLSITGFGATAEAMTPEVAVTGLVGNTLADDCLGIPNTVLTLTVLAADFNAAPPGAYADTLTLLVEPE